jgi:hypothetical protein
MDHKPESEDDNSPEIYKQFIETAGEIKDILVNKLNIPIQHDSSADNPIEYSAEDFYKIILSIARSNAFSEEELPGYVDRTALLFSIFIEFGGVDIAGIMNICKNATGQEILQLGEKHKKLLNNKQVSEYKINALTPKSLVARIKGYGFYDKGGYLFTDLYKKFWELKDDIALPSNLNPSQSIFNLEEGLSSQKAYLIRNNIISEKNELSDEEVRILFFQQMNSKGREAFFNELELNIFRFNEVGLFSANQSLEMLGEMDVNLTKEHMYVYAKIFREFEDSNEYFYEDFEKNSFTYRFMFFTPIAIDYIERIEKIKNTAPEGYQPMYEILSELPLEIQEVVDLETLPYLFYKYAQRVNRFGHVADEKSKGIRVYDVSERLARNLKEKSEVEDATDMELSNKLNGRRVLFFNKEDIDKYVQFKLNVHQALTEAKENPNITLLTEDLKGSIKLPNGIAIEGGTVRAMLRKNNGIIEGNFSSMELNGLKVRGVRFVDISKLKDIYPQEEEWNSFIDQNKEFAEQVRDQDYSVLTSKRKDSRLDFNLDFSSLDIIDNKEESKKLLLFADRSAIQTDYSHYITEKLGLNFDTPEDLSRFRGELVYYQKRLVEDLEEQGVKLPGLRFGSSFLVLPAVWDQFFIPYVKGKLNRE